MADINDLYYGLVSLYLGYWEALGQYLNEGRWERLWAADAETGALSLEKLRSSAPTEHVIGLLKDITDVPPHVSKHDLESNLRVDYSRFVWLVDNSERKLAENEDEGWIDDFRAFRARCRQVGLSYASLLPPPKKEDGFFNVLSKSYPPDSISGPRPTA